MKAVNENLRYYTAFIVLAVLALFFLDHLTSYQTGYAAKGGCHGKRCPPPSTGTCTVTRTSDGSTTIYAGENYTIAGKGLPPNLPVTVYPTLIAYGWAEATLTTTTDSIGGFSVTHISGYNGDFSARVVDTSAPVLLTSCPYYVKALGT